MPNTKSAKKRLKQDAVRRLRNRARRSGLKTEIKQVRAAIAAGKLDVAEAEFRAATKKLDQTAAAGVIHRNAAARAKSRLSASIKALRQKAPAK